MLGQRFRVHSGVRVDNRVPDVREPCIGSGRMTIAGCAVRQKRIGSCIEYNFGVATPSAPASGVARSATTGDVFFLREGRLHPRP